LSTYVVGDIQGCLQPLKCLLKRVEFNADRDMLWSVGDVVNRGPKCLKTLRFLHGMRDNLVMVLGNHDLHLMAVSAGVRRPNRSDTFDKILAAKDRQELINWLHQQPLLHREHGFTMVHAGIPPQWTIDEAAGYAREVEAVLRSERCVEFFQHMYGNEPDKWSEELTGMTRLRVITNYLTRMRYCTRKGRLDLISKGAHPEQGKKKMSAWFSHPERKAKDDKILFGHWASLEGRTDSPNAIGLDTGCVWGGSMSLYELETGVITRCHCQDGRCPK
jgi:bis(5'-nucleosyl)-tetraphosphatase (symmetrical)